jgi:dTDP-4-amino-4,6-dideoxygalactose transaminase
MFDAILKFEQALAEYTGAPYVVMTDCCTHAIELCLRHNNVEQTAFTPFTYLSVPMTMHKLGITHMYTEEEWIGEYQFHGTNIWDSARLLSPNMYREGQMQCLSFGFGKPLQVGRGGAILLDDKSAYDSIILQRYDGRNLTYSPWDTQRTFKVGYHYRPTPEEAILALEKLGTVNPIPQYFAYPDLRNITIVT